MCTQKFSIINMARSILCIAIFTIASLSLVLGNGCHPRDYGYGATVCVCSEKFKCEGDLNVKVSKEDGVITSYSTNKNGARFLHREYRFLKEIPAEQHFNVTIEVNHGKKYQKIIGFGGAFTDATGINIAKLPKDLQTRLVKDYFGSDGIEYTLGRIPIGGSDFSPRAYSYDDHPKDETLSTFALQPEDFNYKLPYLRQAKQTSNREVKYFGSPWSSPAWMKTNKALNHGGFLIGEPGGKYYSLFAKYIVKFLEEYKNNNVSLWGLTVENEPQFGWNPHYAFNSLGFNGSMERDYVKKNLGPELARSQFADTKIMIFDDNIPRIKEFVTTVLTDTDAAKYTAGVAFHWYDNRVSNRSLIDSLAEQFTDKFFLSTEACEDWWKKKPQHVFLGHWDTFDRYADDIINDLNHYAGGWVDWNMALDLQGGPNWVGNFVDAPIIVNATSQEYYRQPFFYALGHFSKFIVPNSVRVDHYGESDAADSVLVTVFERPDKSTVLTVLNKNSQPIMFKLHDPLKGFLTTDIMANSLETLIWY